MKRAQALVSASAVAAIVIVGLTSSGSVQASSGSAGDDGHRRVGPTVSQAKRHALVAARVQQVQADEKELRIGPNQDLVVKDVLRDTDGTEHVRYNRTYDGLPVIGGDLVRPREPRRQRAVGRAGPAATGSPCSLPPTRRCEPRARSSEPASRPGRRTREGRVRRAAQAGPRLGDHSSPAPRRTARRSATSSTPTRSPASSSAASRRSWTPPAPASRSTAAAVSLQTTLSGSTYQLTDGTRGGHSTYDANNSTSTARGTLFTDADNAWGNGTTSSRQSAAVDARYGAAETWDLYKAHFNRTGIRNDGVAAYSRVHYGNSYENAFWDDSCFCMTYGDGGTTFSPLASLDVAGHEMSHGVTAATSGLDYSGDAGGLNEATSDVFGTMVEFEAANASDPGDYYIGEKITKNGTYLRRMDNPSLTAARRTAGPRRSATSTRTTPRASATTSSTCSPRAPAPRPSAAARTAPRPATARTLTGIGRDQAAAIWYRAMTTYWTSTTTYPQAANGMIQGARDLYGRNSDHLQEGGHRVESGQGDSHRFLRHRGGVLHRCHQHQQPGLRVRRGRMGPEPDRASSRSP